MEEVANIRFFLADDHPLVRAGLKHSLGLKKGFNFSGEASDGYSAVERIREDPPDICLIDMDMPGLSGTAVVRILKKSMSDLKFLMLSTFGDEKFIREAMGAGADGYLLKSVPIDDLEKIIRTFCAGKPSFSPYLINLSLEDTIVRDQDKQDVGLTGRELEVLRYIASGTSNKGISSELFISVETVKSHVKNIYKKLDVRNRVEAVRLAAKRNILD